MLLGRLLQGLVQHLEPWPGRRFILHSSFIGQHFLNGLSVFRHHALASEIYLICCMAASLFSRRPAETIGLVNNVVLQQR